ncbi:MAG: hypothetical protein ACXW4B_05380 [Micavibrio sp.]
MAANGPYNSFFQHVSSSDFRPAPRLPIGLTLHRARPGGGACSLLIAVSCKLLHKDFTILAIHRETVPASHIPDEKFIERALSRHHQIDKGSTQRFACAEIISALVAPGVLHQAEMIAGEQFQLQDNLRKFHKAQKAVRRELGDLFNLPDSRILRLEKRADFILALLQKHLAPLGGACTLNIAFEDGTVLSGSGLENLKPIPPAPAEAAKKLDSGAPDSSHNKSL